MPVNNIGHIEGLHKKTPQMTPGGAIGEQSILSLTGDKHKTGKEKLEILAKEFEAIFINQMLKTMRSTINKSGLIDGGSAEEIFTSMQDEEMARQMAFSQQNGLSTALVEQLSSMLKDDKDSLKDKNEQ